MPSASFWYFMKNQHLKFKGLVCFLIFGYGLLNIDITIKNIYAPSSWGEILEVKREMPQEGIYGYLELFLINLFYLTFQLL